MQTMHVRWLRAQRTLLARCCRLLCCVLFALAAAAERVRRVGGRSGGVAGAGALLLGLVLSYCLLHLVGVVPIGRLSHVAVVVAAGLLLLGGGVQQLVNPLAQRALGHGRPALVPMAH